MRQLGAIRKVELNLIVHFVLSVNVLDSIVFSFVAMEIVAQAIFVYSLKAKRI